MESFSVHIKGLFAAFKGNPLNNWFFFITGHETGTTLVDIKELTAAVAIGREGSEGEVGGLKHLDGKSLEGMDDVRIGLKCRSWRLTYNLEEKCLTSFIFSRL